MKACTVVTSGYLPFARVLAESFVAHHPGGEFTVVVVDPDPAQRKWDLPGVRFSTAADLGFTREELLVRAAIYDEDEYCASFKPAALRALIGAGAPAALLLDRDIEVYANLDHVFEAAERSGVVLSPHTTVPWPEDGSSPTELTIVNAGAFNSGFVAVGQTGRAFLEWWDARLSRSCLRRPGRGPAAEEGWLNLVPALFDCLILKNPALHLAYARLEQAGWGPTEVTWGYSASPGGITLDTPLRDAWRVARLEFERGGSPPPPDPFRADSGFDEWANRVRRREADLRRQAFEESEAGSALLVRLRQAEWYRERFGDMERALAAAETGLWSVQSRLAAVLSSTSWRITRPLRIAKDSVWHPLAARFGPSGRAEIGSSPPDGLSPEAALILSTIEAAAEEGREPGKTE